MTDRIKYGRFHWDCALEKIIDYETCESYYDDECVDILNTLNFQNFNLTEDNKRLKQQLKDKIKYIHQLEVELKKKGI